MKIIALEHESPTATAEQFRLYLKDEATQLWNLVQSGVVRETYFRSDQHTAVLILECQDLDEAEHALVRVAALAALFRFRAPVCNQLMSV